MEIEKQIERRSRRGEEKREERGEKRRKRKGRGEERRGEKRQLEHTVKIGEEKRGRGEKSVHDVIRWLKTLTEVM